MEIPDDVRQSELAADKKESDRAAKTAKGSPSPAAAAAPAPAKTPAAEADDDSNPLPDEWPESARAQVMAERKKRQKRTEELTQEREKRTAAEGRAQELETQLQAGGGAAPVALAPGADPVANVFNFQQLNKTAAEMQQSKRDQEELLDFTARYPRGVPGVLLGHDKDGNEVRRDYSEEEISEMRVGAQQKLRHLGDALGNGGALHRRSAYLHERAQFDPLARKLYTDKERTAAGLPALGSSLVFDENGQLTPEASTIARQMPQIMQYSDALLNIGRYLRGLKLEQEEMETLARKGGGANGNANSLPDKLKPFARPTPPIAPSAPGARSPGTPAGGRTSGDVDKAEQKVIESGGTDDQAIEDLIDASLTSGRAQRERAPA